MIAPFTLVITSALAPTPGPVVEAEHRACEAVSSAADNLAPVANYDVFRGGKKIGHHSIRLERADGLVVASIHTEMRVRFLFFTAYEYSYSSEEIWCGDDLRQVRTRVLDNGKEINVALTAADIQALRDLNGNFATTNHWNPNAMKAGALFNTITGQVNTVTVKPLNSDPETGLTTYDVTGDLNIQTTYDSAGNWRGMHFVHKDGSKIEFRRSEAVQIKKTSQP